MLVPLPHSCKWSNLFDIVCSSPATLIFLSSDARQRDCWRPSHFKQHSCSSSQPTHLHIHPSRLPLSRRRRKTNRMAANGSSDSFAPDTILAAMTTMRGGEPDKKKAAMDYLTKFQKSVGTALRHTLYSGCRNCILLC